MNVRATAPKRIRGNTKKTSFEYDKAAAEKVRQEAERHKELMRALFGPLKQQG